jgi:hypothetical protein
LQDLKTLKQCQEEVPDIYFAKMLRPRIEKTEHIDHIEREPATHHRACLKNTV